MNRHTLTVVTALALATGPSALSTANAFGSLQPPDARDANIAAQTSQAAPTVDLRSPDARDASRHVVSQPSSVTRVDLRSPDTRDVANGVRFVTVPPVQVVHSPSSRGFEWGDAGIGAGGAVLIALIALGTGVAVQHRRHLPRTRTPLAG